MWKSFLVVLTDRIYTHKFICLMGSHTSEADSFTYQKYFNSWHYQQEQQILSMLNHFIGLC
jgi:hypothetical protein